MCHAAGALACIEAEGCPVNDDHSQAHARSRLAVSICCQPQAYGAFSGSHIHRTRNRKGFQHAARTGNRETIDFIPGEFHRTGDIQGLALRRRDGQRAVPTASKILAGAVIVKDCEGIARGFPRQVHRIGSMVRDQISVCPLGGEGHAVGRRIARAGGIDRVSVRPAGKELFVRRGELVF